jgi:hypothetical protein
MTPRARDLLDLTTANGAAELESRIQDQVGGHLHGFQVVIRDGGLVLRGRTSTYYTKQLVQHAVMEATSLPIVANEIEVD